MSMFFNHSLMMMTMRMRMMVMILGMVMIMMMIMITMMIMMSMVNRMVIIIIIMVGHVSTENIFDMIFSKLYVKIIKIKKKINNNLILTNDKIQ